MFSFDEGARSIATRISAWVAQRVGNPPPPRAPGNPTDLIEQLRPTITPGGIGADAAFAAFTEVIAPAAIPLDSPRHCALIPGAPTAAATLFDAAVSAAALVPEAWIEASGAVAAENETLRWLAGLAGLPEEAGGCFVSGGTAGNLSALAAARDAHGAGRRTVAVGAEAHSSIARSLRTLALDALVVPSDGSARLRADTLAAALDAAGPAADDVFAVVATAGSTNAGTVDDLSGIAAVAHARELWMHVDGAYGAAALCAPAARHRFAGIEHADSVIIDPHKWLFGPLDCCALLYRDPERARQVHRQSASYLDTMRLEGMWDPGDYAIHLTRRARGLPLWFSLAVHGSDAYGAAVQTAIDNAAAAARRVDASPHLELLLEPELGIVLFRRTGWQEADYVAWARGLLDRGVAFVLPTRWQGETVGRFVFLHPGTTVELFDEVIAAMA